MHLLHVASIFCFNPRTTQGSTFWVVPCIVIMLVSILAHRVRLPSLTRKIQTFVVSIHAPTRGATCRASCIVNRQGFNPRTHTGCDSKISFCLSTELSFNPRTHTGCDVGLLVSVWRGGGFNPRTHTGCDAYRCSPTSACSCFNPRTHTGCDCVSFASTIISSCFNPRTHMGCDDEYLEHLLDTAVSIHAPTWGATVEQW